jgi:hypothetical protein
MAEAEKVAVEVDMVAAEEAGVTDEDRRRPLDMQEPLLKLRRKTT